MGAIETDNAQRRASFGMVPKHDIAPAGEFQGDLCETMPGSHQCGIGIEAAAAGLALEESICSIRAIIFSARIRREILAGHGQDRVATEECAVMQPPDEGSFPPGFEEPKEPFLPIR